MIKKITVILIFCFIFALPVSANEIYSEEYDLSGADKLWDSIPQEINQYLQDMGIDPKDYNWVNNLKSESVFSHIWQFVKSGAKAPVEAGVGVLAVILVSAAFGFYSQKSSVTAASLYASALAAVAVIAMPVFSVINSSVNALKGCTVFMTSFIPIFAAIVAASGKSITSVSMSALMLTATQTISYIANFAVMPLMGGYLATSIAASVSPLVDQTGISAFIKKVSMWTMAFISTVFVGILNIQTAVNTAADGLALKTAKFIVGSSVPIAGTALSEAMGTVSASMGLLKSSVGIYGVVVIFIILLPLVCELLIWRVVLMLSAAVGEMFSLPKISALLKAVDTVLSVLVGIVLLTGAMFIISLSVVVTVGKA